MSVIDEIAAERKRQIEKENWTSVLDDRYTDYQLASAAVCYVVHAQCPDYLRKEMDSPPGWWPWHRVWWKPSTRRRDLIKAAALIVAELERMDRQENKNASKQSS